MSTAVYKWRPLAYYKLLQSVQQEIFCFANKHIKVANFLTEIQQMVLVVCHRVYQLFQNLQFCKLKRIDGNTCVT